MQTRTGKHSKDMHMQGVRGTLDAATTAHLLIRRWRWHFQNVHQL